MSYKRKIIKKLIGLVSLFVFFILNPTQILAATIYQTPDGSSFKSYMDYRTITSQSSSQYRLQKECDTDENGLRIWGDRYVVAVGTRFNAPVGTMIDVYLDTGIVLPCIVGDIKQDIHTGDDNIQVEINGNIIEFVVDERIMDPFVANKGDISYYDGFDGNVSYVVVYEPDEDPSLVEDLNFEDVIIINNSGEFYRSEDGVFRDSYGNAMTGAVKKGIDVSSYQNDIDWRAVANDGIEFAFIRAGSLRYGVDKKLRDNAYGCRRNAIPFGLYVYSYATTKEQAEAEAKFLIAYARIYGAQYPLVIDMESEAQKALSSKELQSIAFTFSREIKKAGYTPMVYSSKSWFAGKIDALSGSKWVAQYNTSCTYNSTFEFWQYSSKGSVAGISGRVDMNLQFTDKY